MTKRRTFEQKTYTSIKEYQSDWLKAFRQAGHRPVMFGRHVDSFAYNPHDPHNGPRCTICDEGWCWHCTPPWGIVNQKCGGKAHKAKVEKNLEDSVLAQAAQIRKRRRAALTKGT